MNKTFLGLADMENPPEGYEKYIWSCDGCVKGIRWCKEHGKAYEVLPNKWLDEAKVDEAVAYLKGVREKLIAALADELNAYLNEDYGIGAWNTLLYAWLCMYLFPMYDKYLNLKYIADNNIYADTVTCTTAHETIPADNSDYSHRMQSDWYNLYQYSLLADIMKSENIVQITAGDDDYDCDRGKTGIKEAGHKDLKIRKTLAQWFVGAMCKLGIIFCRKNVVLIAPDTGIPVKLIFKCWMRTGAKVLPVIYSSEQVRNCIEHTPPNAGWRASTLKIPEGVDEFSVIAFRLAKKYLPIAYVEGHDPLKHYLCKKYKDLQMADKLICGAACVRFDDFLNLMYAEMRERGAYICGVQHGGNYGIEKLWLYDDEISLSDMFYTWGWTQDVYGDGSKVMRPMPVLKDMRHSYTDMSDGTKVLYITYSSSRYPIWAMRMELLLGERMREERYFLRGLREDIRSHMTIRLYMEDYGWGTREAIERDTDRLIFDNDTSLTESINRHSFIVISDWQTTVNEVLFSEKPFLFLRDTSHLINDAVSDIEELHAVGVACYTWEELKTRIEEIYPHHAMWWQDTDRQEVIGRIKAKYAWRSDNAEYLWEREIEKLCLG